MIEARIHYQFGGKHKVEMIDEYDTVEAAIADMRRLWNEDDSDGTSITVWDDEHLVATMIKPVADPEICVTIYTADGRIEHHRCVYVLGEDGMYDHTEITEERVKLVCV